jgi:uncharacterized protein (DUF2345 family)
MSSLKAHGSCLQEPIGKIQMKAARREVVGPTQHVELLNRWDATIRNSCKENLAPQKHNLERMLREVPIHGFCLELSKRFA